ncbi:hypothetical protein [Pandoraea sp. XY-2]|nr:hypothetical protein [Pandoraea sp. XY-2]
MRTGQLQDLIGFTQFLGFVLKRLDLLLLSNARAAAPLRIALVR